jgi:hypothetical protein
MTKDVEQNSDVVDSNSDSIVGDGEVSVGNDQPHKQPRSKRLERNALKVF